MNEYLTHLNAAGDLKMVDTSSKEITFRKASASVEVRFPKDVFDRLEQDQWLSSKGSIFQVARIAAINAAKKTSEIIPLCHQINLENVAVEFTAQESVVKIKTTVSAFGRTGVEMEALTAASAAALCLYDMCKAMAHNIVINLLQLDEKIGGKSIYSRQ